MNIFTKDWYQTKCEEIRIKPEKDRGQHFLIDRNVAVRIAEAAHIEGKQVLEVGPGFGVLTAELISRALNVISVETEEKFVRLLPETLGNPKNLAIVSEDFLKYNEGEVEGEYHLVTNLPYSISSHVFYKMLESDHAPASLTMLLQKEVVQRVCAKAGDMNQLALLVQLYGKPKLMFTVSHEQFWPRPKVQSAVLHLVRHDEDSPIRKLLKDYSLEISEIISVARAGFLNPRKQLGNSLAATYPQALEALKQAHIDASSRPESLKVTDWISLTNALASS